MHTRVVASIIERDGRVLVCERPDDKRHGGLWEFPGGKIEGEETATEAIARELWEELEVRVLSVGPNVFSVADPGSPYLLEYHRVEIEGEPRCLEHAALAWVTDAELIELPLAPGDLAYARCRVGGEGGPITPP